MATEVAFAKSFLSLLDSKPAKISPDHVEDPRGYPGSIPYTIPKHPSCKPFSKISSSSARSSATSAAAAAAATTETPALTVILRSPRNPAFDLKLPAQAPSTSLAEIKERVVQETGIDFGKIKLLFNKKPVADSKALKDLLGGPGVGEGNGGAVVVELGVMVLGGASVTLKKKDEPAGNGQGQGPEEREGTSVGAPVAQGLSGMGVLETGQFWDDLKGFLQQRVRDEGVAGEALGVFKAAWEGRS